MLATILVIFTLGISINVAFAQETNQQNDCISYSVESERNQISISCPKGVTLSDISSAIQNPDLLKKEDDSTWLLDSRIVVEPGATLVVDSKDTTWLKMLTGDKNGDGDRDNVNSIIVLGNLIVDSVKISSWDPQTSDYIKFEYDILPDREHEHTGIDAVPRPYIKADDETTGTMNITNSELLYLGYECGSGCSGQLLW